MKNLTRMMILMMFMIAALRLPIIVKGTTAPSGTGTSGDPYLISSLANLEWMRDEVNDGPTGVDLTGKYFKQTSDINLESITSWVPIGVGTNQFQGSYDGDGFKIRNLKISETYSSGGNTGFGFFGSVGGNSAVEIKNIYLYDVNISVTDSGNNVYVGAVIGYANASSGVFSNLMVDGSTYRQVTTSNSTGYAVGGIIGQLNSGTLKNSFSTMNIQGFRAGGLVGLTAGSSILKDSFYSGNTVTGNYSGILVGDMAGSASGLLYNNASTSGSSNAFAANNSNPRATATSVNLSILKTGNTFSTTTYFSTAWDNTIWAFPAGYDYPRIGRTTSTLSSLKIETQSITSATEKISTCTYDSTISKYVCTVNLEPYSDHVWIKITPTATSSAYSIITRNLAVIQSGSPTASITLTNDAIQNFDFSVSSQLGNNSTNYRLKITRALNADKTLASLGLSAGSITFNPSTLNYSFNVPYSTSSLQVTPTSNDPYSLGVYVQNAVVARGSQSSALTLNPGSNTINILVYAENNSSQTYVLNVNRLPLGTDASLSSLIPSSGSLSFSPTTLNYQISVPNSTNNFSLTPTSTLSTSTLSVNGVTNANSTASTLTSLVEGLNTFNVLVTAEDGITTQTYTVNVTREAPIVVPTINTATSVFSSNEQLPNTGVGSGLFGLVPLGLATLNLTRRRMSK